MTVHPELTTEEYLTHLEGSERTDRELTLEDYRLLANQLAKMAYDWMANPEGCADWWGSNEPELILANAAVCVQRLTDLVEEKQKVDSE